MQIGMLNRLRRNSLEVFMGIFIFMHKKRHWGPFLFFFIFILTLGLGISQVDAKVFSNSYISFKIPDEWNCISEKTEWICRHRKQKESKEAVVILTSKQANLAKDNLSAYFKHLKKPQLIYSRDKKILTSKVIHVKSTLIKGLQWVDGWHLNSEVPNYYTRYLGTVRNNLGVLMTCSIHKSVYTRYNKVCFDAIASLHIHVGKNFFKSGNRHRLGGTLGSRFTAALEKDEEDILLGSQDNSTLIGILVVLVLGGIGLILFAKKKKRKPKRMF